VFESAARANHIRDTRGRLEDERHAAAVETAEEVLVLRAGHTADVRERVGDFGDDWGKKGRGSGLAEKGRTGLAEMQGRGRKRWTDGRGGQIDEAGEGKGKKKENGGYTLPVQMLST
jgi:hypothetical protein